MSGPVSLRARRRRRQAVLRWLVLLVVGTFLVLPLLAMLEFTTRGPDDTRNLQTWSVLVHLGQLNTDYPELVAGVRASAGLVVLTVALMLLLLVPAMVWVRLRLPGLRRWLEFICLLPLTIPAVVLVVGLAPVYAWVVYLIGGSSLTLCLAYTVLVLPYAYRALDAGLSAIDVKTLAEAARSLGAGWGTVMLRVIMPNVRAAVLSACFVTVTLVLGEFTIASLLNRQNIQVATNLLSKRDASVSIAVSLAFLILAFVLLMAISLLSGRRRPTRDPVVQVATPAPAGQPTTADSVEAR